ncbi:hypothetical protein OJAV_G00014830 [Oryzias javanicus]|uniref:Uncharacterized protein n=1 Tax=Oryzias javanicus TaxID=123683 RepID=A0A3S2MVA4_ORYJA|nr:hypothetical protein OJAV_G00014830 [Oryzias javanicus]
MASFELCSASRFEKTRDGETVGPSIHGNPSQVHWFICNSGNSTYNEKPYTEGLWYSNAPGFGRPARPPVLPRVTRDFPSCSA